MNKVILAALALFSSMSFAAYAAEQMTKEELIQYATDKNACGEDKAVLDAYYKDTGAIGVKCGDATGFVPLLGALGVGAGGAAAAVGIALVAAASGSGSGSTPDTTQ